MLTRIFIVLLFFNTITRCQSKQTNQVSGQAPNYTISLNEQFTITLPSNPTTGYKWLWSNKKNIERIDSVRWKFKSDTSKFVGSGGIEYWTYKGVRPGIDTLKFKYCQPWDPKTVAKHKAIVILVK